ncbi:nuclear transport factor 2 family protein [Nocardioides sp. W7]|uniref:nuclear transport factor 2 family protein n=1 Tax=Nocardioides sp. W7 TaxID=2931390 RepID=UPI001FD30762|nr:nuclear transport factor 2 family protein [Nocardioides sp. W7]
MTQQETDDLAARLVRLEECGRAADILHTFAASLDDPDLATVLPLFREDAVLVSPRRTARGRAEIASFFTEAWSADPSVKRHFVMSPRVTWLGPGRVRLETYFTFIGRMPDSSVLGWGTYDDVVDVTGPEPRFAEVRMESHLRTDLDQGWAAAPVTAGAQR